MEADTDADADVAEAEAGRLLVGLAEYNRQFGVQWLAGRRPLILSALHLTYFVARVREAQRLARVSPTASVSPEDRALLELGEAMAACPWLQVTAGRQVDHAVALDLRLFRAVRCLELQDCKVVALEGVEAITTVKCTNSNVDVRPFAALEHLTVSHSPAFDAGLVPTVGARLQSLAVVNSISAACVVEEDGTVAEVWARLVGEDSQSPRSNSHAPTAFPALTSMRLTSNALVDVPTAVAHFTALVTLDLSYNDIHTIHRCTRPLLNLLTLCLRGNVLTSLDELGSLAPNLTALDASHNLIERLNGLRHVPRLERLDLRNNRLSDWRQVALLADEGSTVLSDVGLRGNPLTDQLRDGDRHYRRVCIAFFFRRPTLRLDDAPVTLYERLSCRAALLKSNVLAAMDRSVGRSTDQPGVSPNAADRPSAAVVTKAPRRGTKGRRQRPDSPSDTVSLTSETSGVGWDAASCGTGRSQRSQRPAADVLQEAQRLRERLAALRGTAGTQWLAAAQHVVPLPSPAVSPALRPLAAPPPPPLPLSPADGNSPRPTLPELLPPSSGPGPPAAPASAAAPPLTSSSSSWSSAAAASNTGQPAPSQPARVHDPTARRERFRSQPGAAQFFAAAGREAARHRRGGSTVQPSSILAPDFVAASPLSLRLFLEEVIVEGLAEGLWCRRLPPSSAALYGTPLGPGPPPWEFLLDRHNANWSTPDDWQYDSQWVVKVEQTTAPRLKYIAVWARAGASLGDWRCCAVAQYSEPGDAAGNARGPDSALELQNVVELLAGAAPPPEDYAGEAGVVHLTAGQLRRLRQGVRPTLNATVLCSFLTEGEDGAEELVRLLQRRLDLCYLQRDAWPRQEADHEAIEAETKPWEGSATLSYGEVAASVAIPLALECLRQPEEPDAERLEKQRTTAVVVAGADVETWVRLNVMPRKADTTALLCVTYCDVALNGGPEASGLLVLTEGFVHLCSDTNVPPTAPRRRFVPGRAKAPLFPPLATLAVADLRSLDLHPFLQACALAFVDGTRLLLRPRNPDTTKRILKALYSTFCRCSEAEDGRLVTETFGIVPAIRHLPKPTIAASNPLDPAAVVAYFSMWSQRSPATGKGTSPKNAMQPYPLRHLCGSWDDIVVALTSDLLLLLQEDTPALCAGTSGPLLVQRTIPIASLMQMAMADECAAAPEHRVPRCRLTFRPPGPPEGSGADAALDLAAGDWAVLHGLCRRLGALHRAVAGQTLPVAVEALHDPA